VNVSPHEQINFALNVVRCIPSFKVPPNDTSRKVISPERKHMIARLTAREMRRPDGLLPEKHGPPPSALGTIHLGRLPRELDLARHQPEQRPGAENPTCS